MPSTVPFSKYHGLGNDFLVIDRRGGEVPMDRILATRLCDRHFGVGADGVLSVLAPTAAGADLRMVVHNADGSEPETCGNGLRCVAWYALNRIPELAGKRTLAIETGGGVVTAEGFGDDPEQGEVRISMGTPGLLAGDVAAAAPLPETGNIVEAPLELAGRKVPVTCVSMGNPHAVIFDRAGPEDAETLGPLVAQHAAFPGGVNAGFARAESDHEVTLRVYERGAGLTLACGTGACAAVVAGVLTGRLEAGREVTVHLPGGDLVIEVAPGPGEVMMRGPAVHVFDGTIDLARFGGAP